MSDWGGKREGAGRKGRDLGKTVVMRVPVSRIEEIKQLINNENNQSKFSDNTEIQALIVKWESLVTPERSKQPRWENAARLLQELKNIVQESP
jgi:hypothetical protein